MNRIKGRGQVTDPITKKQTGSTDFSASNLCEVKLKDRNWLLDILPAPSFLFNLGNIGSVSFITHQVRKRANEDGEFKGEIEQLTKSIMKTATCRLGDTS